MSLGENSLVAAYQGKGQLKSRPSGTGVVTNSFNHYMNLYSASSRLLLRSTPDSSTAKKSSFKARVEYVRVNPGEQSQCQWKPIPSRGSYDREWLTR